MKLYIPEIGDEIKLATDWTFDLYNEYRNETLMTVMNDIRETFDSEDQDFGAIPCTIPAGEILIVDRIYIRKGQEDFSSISFFWKNRRTLARIEEYPANRRGPAGVTVTEKKPARPVRFWAKLADTNNIEFEPL